MINPDLSPSQSKKRLVADLSTKEAAKEKGVLVRIKKHPNGRCSELPYLVCIYPLVMRQL